MSKKTKKNKSGKSLFTRVSIVAVMAGVVLAVMVGQKSQNTKAHAASSTITGAERYGIAVGGGFSSLSTTEMSNRLDDMKSMGVHWIRFDLSWSNVQSGGSTSYNWTRYDNVINAVQSRGMKVLPIIDATPVWARLPICNTEYFCQPANMNDFANFAKQASLRYAPMGVHYWEIWNEPNLSGFWKPKPDVAAYSSMIKLAYQAIKQADPTAIIVSGGMSPAVTDGTNIAPVDFLKGMYVNGVQGSFDALGHHPYCYSGSFDCPKTVIYWSAWSQMYDQDPNGTNSSITTLRELMVANGDGSKQIWATEFGAPVSGSAAVTESHQAQMVTDAYSLFSSYNWSGPLFWYTYKDKCNDALNRECWFGLRRFDGSQRPSYNAFKNSVPPTVSIVSPSNGSTVSIGSNVTINANASDNVGVTKVKFYVNGTLKCRDTTAVYSCLWNVPSESNVTYTLKAIAYDAAGNSSTSKITVTAR